MLYLYAPESKKNMIHSFNRIVLPSELPQQFTYPFCYTPHALCIEAAAAIRQYLASRSEWQEELQQGKMFGVLIVQQPNGGIGFLAAFSGLLCGSNKHEYFVPPIYDLQQEGGYFRREEAAISLINKNVCALETSADYLMAKTRLTEIKKQAESDLSDYKALMAANKENRRMLREEGQLTYAQQEELLKQSQFEKAEYKRKKKNWDECIGKSEDILREYDNQITQLKKERKRRSAALQQWLFGQFILLNARNEERNLNDIFAQTPQQIPPAGSGECAAPKLLQYAYLHQLKPIAMAEFWWGDSPVGEIRRHGTFYPSCTSKCGPILGFMLQGLQVEPNPLQQTNVQEPTLLYKDAWIIAVDKPHGMLSVPGKTDAPTVTGWLKREFPNDSFLQPVHRLDMDTSGILLIARNPEAYAIFQAMFQRREMQKNYMALLEGKVTTDEGVIDLPLSCNWEHRPEQMVDFEHGKPALTTYQVLQRIAGRTRILFTPHTGRTHQLRVHAAHPQGLNCPIVGDKLYGKGGTQLHLHACRLAFTHPFSGEQLVIESKVPF